MVAASVPPQLQFANVLTQWKVTIQRPGYAKSFETTPFNAPSAQLTVNNLLPATEYRVWVSVRSSSAEGPLSNHLDVSTWGRGEIGNCMLCDVIKLCLNDHRDASLSDSSSAPGPVAAISASPASATSVKLFWTPPRATNGRLTSYHIDYRSTNELGIPHNGQLDLPASTTSYTVTRLKENTLYHFTVSAETIAGRGEGSSVSVQTSTDSESLRPSGALLV